MKKYDFKRPDRFLKKQCKAMESIFGTFSGLCTSSLSDRLRLPVNIHVASVDELTYEEFIRSVPTPTTLVTVNMDPLKGNAILEIDPAITISIINQLRLVYENNESKISVIMKLFKEIIVDMLDEIKDAWIKVIDLCPAIVMIDNVPQFVQIAQPSDMVILVTMESKIGEIEGMINFCMPYAVIKPLINKPPFLEVYIRR